MIKKKVLFVILIFNFRICFGQHSEYSLLPIENEFRLLLIGENHNNYEKDTVELEIIKWYAQQSKKKIVVFIERPFSMQLFIDKLFKTGDSLSLKQYLAYSYDRTANVFLTKEQNIYHKILSIYELNKTTNNLKIKCIDRELFLRAMLYSIKDVLVKYNKVDVHRLIKKIDKYLIKEVLTIQDYEFIRFFYQYNMKYRLIEGHKNITFSDIYYINELFEGFKPMISNSDSRESFLYYKMINNWEKDKLHISINGLAHVNKYYSETNTIIGNRKSIGYLLSTCANSPYVNNVKSIAIVNFNIKTTNKTKKVKNCVYFMSKEEKSYLYTLCKKKRQFVIPDPEKFKYANKAYDLLILVDTVHAHYNPN